MKKMILSSLIFLALRCDLTVAQDNKNEKIITVSARVGDTIDVQERVHFKLFQTVSQFESARYVMTQDSNITLEITELDAQTQTYRIKRIPQTKEMFIQKGNYIDHYEEITAGNDRTKGTDSARITHVSHSTWFSVGLGGCSVGPAAQLQFSIIHKKAFLSVRGLFSKERLLTLFGDLKSPENSISDIGILCGIRSAIQGGFVSFSAGMSRVAGVQRGKYLYSTGFFLDAKDVYERISINTMGIPFEAKITLDAGKWGIGIGVSGNVNSKLSYGAFILSLEPRTIWFQ
jgi:hypothetical protein